MKDRFTPYYTDLIYDATLKSFWRKRVLRKFLRECNISEGFLSTWSEDETKRDFLDRLFDKLLQTDKGKNALLKMAEFLIEQSSFPDLQNWEDSEEKIKNAHVAIEKLRVYHNKQEEELQNEEMRKKVKKEFREKQNEVSRSQQTLADLTERLNILAQKLGSQEAGYDFQDWFYDLMDFFEITNRRPYTHEGRQIDGSITLFSTTYLVELKFTSDQTGAPDIDTFYKKITSKADNTMGIMVSVSGYSSIAMKEASGDRTPMLLMDHNHIYYVLSGVMGMTEIIDRIRRHASQTGESYLSPSKFGY